MKPTPMDILLVDGEGVFAHPVAICLAQQPGVRLHVLADRSRTPLRYSRHRCSYRVHSSRNDTEKLSAIQDALRRTGAVLALPTEQDSIRFVATHRDTLLTALPPMPDADTMNLVSDKWRLVCFLGERGLPHPVSRLAEAPDGSPTDLADMCFPILLKPREGANGNGIRRFDAPESLTRHLRDLKSRAGQYVLQEFLVGEDIDCNVLCDRGHILAYTIQRPFLPSLRPYGPGHCITFQEHPAVMNVIRRLMAVLNWSGVANVDLRLDAAGDVHIIEMNPRYWGSLLGSLAAGVNFPYLSCLAGLGVPFTPPVVAPVRFVIKHRLWNPFLSPHRRASNPAFADLTLAESIWCHTLHDPLPDIFHLLHRNGVL